MTALRHRQPVTENFLQDFGPGSLAFRSASSLWLEAIAALGTHRDYRVSYEDWRKSLRIAHGISVGDEPLFVRHTYLATLAKLLAYLLIAGAETVPEEAQTQAIIQGTFFAKQQIINVSEEDCFSWAGRAPFVSCTQKIAANFANLLFAYRLRELSEDVMKELYQTLVDPQERHDLGEYYTPDWLAAQMCNTLLSKSGEDAVLDPACGSGTFLYQAIRHKKRRLPATRQSLETILASVVGIDIHPLAVVVARMNVLLALGDLLKERSGPVSIRVYLANSLSPSALPPALSPWGERVARDGAFASRSGSGEGVPALPNPASLLNQFDVVIGNPPWVSFRFVEKGEYQDYLKHLIVNEFGLIEGAGHLITHLELATLYFARCATLYLKRSGLIGFVLPRSIFAADQHDRFRRSSGMGNATLTQVWDLEGVSPLFNVPAAVAFGDLISDASSTLPGKILSGRLKRRNASHDEADRELKTQAAEFHLVQQGKRSFLSTSRKKTSGQRSFYQPLFKEGATIVPRSLWFVEIKAPPGPGVESSEPQIVAGKTDSPSDEPARPGASRELVVGTDPRAQAEAKRPYKSVRFIAPIEDEFLYASLLSTDLLPFGHFDFRPVVLPLLQGPQGYRLLNAEQACAKGYMRLAEWLERAQAMWTKRRKEKATKADALAWLNYRNKLAEQNPKGKYVVLYARSATFLCAAALHVAQSGTTATKSRSFASLKMTCHPERSEGSAFLRAPRRSSPPVVQSSIQEAPAYSGDHEIRPRRFIASDATYFLETQKPGEANYLVALLNSPTVDSLIKPMQARGLWGPRDIHKKVWELPIPEFNPKDKAHLRLAEIAIACAEKVKDMVPDLKNTFQGLRGPHAIGRARSAVREALRDELAEIDPLVQGLLGEE